MSDEYGPPTLEDDAWFTQHVASLGYPKVKRDPAPMEGQMSLTQCVCGAPLNKHGYCIAPEEGCLMPPAPLFDMSAAEIDRRMMAALDEEREWADEQRAREAEAEQWRDHRPE